MKINCTYKNKTRRADAHGLRRYNPCPRCLYYEPHASFFVRHCWYYAASTFRDPLLRVLGCNRAQWPHRPPKHYGSRPKKAACPERSSERQAACQDGCRRNATTRRNPLSSSRCTRIYRFEADGTGRKETIARIRVQSEAGVQQWGQLAGRATTPPTSVSKFLMSGCSKKTAAS